MTRKTHDFDASNKYAVAIQGMKIRVGLPPFGTISHDEALNLAAWIVAIVGNDKRWNQIRNAVKES